jgi:hypothetical protein
MSPNLRQPPRTPLRPWLPALLAAAALALLSALPGCGGGVGTGGTGGEAAAFAAGPITGFGSVIVNGVRFDDTSAQVEDGEGGSRGRDELRLGMTVEVDSSAITTTSTGSTASATRIRFESELVGPVLSIDAAAGSFTLLGQRVEVDSATVFDENLDGGLDGLRAGRMVEVYAVYDPSAARYRATRVERTASESALRLRGQLNQVDTAAQTLRVGATTYSYAGASGVPPALAVGQYVRLRLGLATNPVRWVVQSFGTALRELPDGDDAKLKGLISAYASATSFSVSGRPVDASAATFPDGKTGLAVGVRVEVEGRVLSGVLRATKVSIETDEQASNRDFEISGSISAVNAAQGSFVLRGQTVSTTRPGLVYQDGTAADIKVGAKVEVRGRLSADRQRVEATRIKFEN